MYKKIKLNCPRDQDRRYFSQQREHYNNDLTVLFNRQTLFSHLNDCEENLPILLEKDVVWNAGHNTIVFLYKIQMHNTVRESARIAFDFCDDVVMLGIHRPHPVQSVENIDFAATFKINNHQLSLNNDYHRGYEKSISQQFVIDPQKTFFARWTCSKKILANNMVYHDDIVIELI